MSEPAGGVRVVDNPADHRFEAWSGDQLAGLLAYRQVPGGLNLVHTEVKPALRGRGIAGRLVAAAWTTPGRRGSGSSHLPLREPVPRPPPRGRRPGGRRGWAGAP